jgi:antitoxin CptB
MMMQGDHSVGGPAMGHQPGASLLSAHQADEARRRRLRWRARRGLLENDLVLTRFLDRHEASLTDADVLGLHHLLDQTDNELLDLILGRVEPDAELDQPAIRSVLMRLRDA